MLKEIKFTIYNIWKNIQNSKELRVSFGISILGMFINNFTFIYIWYSFGQVSGNIGGWTSMDVFGMLGISTISFGIIMSMFGGIRNIPKIVESGNFDKYLLSPKNITLRLSTSTFVNSAIGDVLFGVVCTAIWFYSYGFGLDKFLILLFFLVFACLIWFFYSLFISSIAFYFMESDSLYGGLFELLITPSIFFGGAFQGLMKIVFIYAIPALLLGALPVEAIKNPSLSYFIITIGVSSFWIFVSILIFKKSIKKYESTNFIGTV